MFVYFRAFPWACAGMFIRGVVTNTLSVYNTPKKAEPKSKEIIADVLTKHQNGANMEQLTRRVSSTERKP